MWRKFLQLAGLRIGTLFLPGALFLSPSTHATEWTWAPFVYQDFPRQVVLRVGETNLQSFVLRNLRATPVNADFWGSGQEGFLFDLPAPSAEMEILLPAAPTVIPPFGDAVFVLRFSKADADPELEWMELVVVGPSDEPDTANPHSHKEPVLCWGVTQLTDVVVAPDSFSFTNLFPNIPARASMRAGNLSTSQTYTITGVDAPSVVQWDRPFPISIAPGRFEELPFHVLLTDTGVWEETVSLLLDPPGDAGPPLALHLATVPAPPALAGDAETVYPITLNGLVITQQVDICMLGTATGVVELVAWDGLGEVPLETVLARLLSATSLWETVMPERVEFSGGESGLGILNGAYEEGKDSKQLFAPLGNRLRTEFGDIPMSNAVISESPSLPGGRYFTFKGKGFLLFVADTGSSARRLRLFSLHNGDHDGDDKYSRFLNGPDGVYSLHFTHDALRPDSGMTAIRHNRFFLLRRDPNALPYPWWTAADWTEGSGPAVEGFAPGSRIIQFFIPDRFSSYAYPPTMPAETADMLGLELLQTLYGPGLPGVSITPNQLTLVPGTCQTIQVQIDTAIRTHPERGIHLGLRQVGGSSDEIRVPLPFSWLRPELLLRQEGGQFVADWTALGNGTHYVLEHRTNLLLGTWTPLQGVTWPTTNATWSGQLENGFIRLRAE